MNKCLECGCEGLSYIGVNILCCDDCSEAFVEHDDGSLEKTDFDYEQFADDAIGDSNWRRE